MKEKTLGDIINEEKKKEEQKLDKKMNAFKQSLGSRVNLSHSPSRSPKKGKPSIE
jgi:hypothetical protein